MRRTKARAWTPSLELWDLNAGVLNSSRWLLLTSAVVEAGFKALVGEAGYMYVRIQNKYMGKAEGKKTNLINDLRLDRATR